MFNFKKILMDDEIILYKGKPVPGKGNKHILGILIFTIYPLIHGIILTWLIKKEHIGNYNDPKLEVIIIILILLGLTGLGLYALIYNILLKKIAVADDTYCLTNLRAIKYESKNKKLTCGYLAKYGEIKVENEKDGYGDAYMCIAPPENPETLTNEEILAFFKENVFNNKLDDRPFIIFESIKNPKKVVDLAIEARDKLNKTNK